MRLITAKCLLSTYDAVFVIGFSASTILFIIYQKTVQTMVVCIVYGILLGCFCIRRDPEIMGLVIELEEDRNANRIFPIETNNNPIIVVTEQV